MSRALVIAAVALTALGCQSSDVSRAVGARCDTSSECDDRCLPDGAGYPDGFCTLVCNSNADCPSGAPCVDREGGACLFACTSDASCAFLGAGWQCKEEKLREPPDQKVMICRGG